MVKNNPPDMSLFVFKPFNSSLRKLARKGGISSNVRRQVEKAILEWKGKIDPGLKRTHHGESRVRHVVKYQLKGAHRLITHEHDGNRFLLFVGSHEDCDHWLATHRGHEFTVNPTTQDISYTSVEVDGETTNPVVGGVQPAGPASGPILRCLPREYVAKLKIPEETLKALNTYVTHEALDEDEDNIRHLFPGLSFPSKKLRSVVTQVVALIAQARVKDAMGCIDVYCKQAKTSTEAPDQFSEALGSGKNSGDVANLNKLSPEQISQILSVEGFTDWMLYLHHDQQKQVDRDYSGPARLIGVSGSGKTSLLVHRADRMARQHVGKCVLVLSLNAALCRLISTLLDDLCTSDIRKQINVMTVYEYCYKVIKTIRPDRLIEKQDIRSGEDLDACWNDFLEKPHAMDSIGSFINILENRDGGIDGSSYVLDELIWIRSGFGREERKQYLTCDRPGRGITLHKYVDGDESEGQSSNSNKKIPKDVRVRLLTLLKDYEEYMQHGGLLDDDGVSLEAFSLKGQISNHETLQARCVFVDEVQDCSTVELAVIGKIPSERKNGLFLTGDPVQKVFAKQCDLTKAQIDIKGRATILRHNYRNTKQILKASFAIVEYFRDIAPLQAQDILQPEYAFRDGPPPSLYECTSHEEQADLIMYYIELLSPEEHGTTCIGSVSDDTLSNLEERLRKRDISTFRITNGSKRAGAIGTGVKLSLLQDLKGYEFKTVFLTDLMDTGYLIPKGAPYEERWRSAFQLYVAMTRARDELIMSFIYNRSILLRPLKDLVVDSEAKDLLA